MIPGSGDLIAPALLPLAGLLGAAAATVFLGAAAAGADLATGLAVNVTSSSLLTNSTS